MSTGFGIEGEFRFALLRQGLTCQEASMLLIPELTFGTGDRFARQGEAQLRAIVEASCAGIPVHPVWNKSHREHNIVGTRPESVRAEADAAVRALGWDKPYFVDADHINLGTVDDYLAGSDFFTLDVAAYVGQEATPADREAFVAANRRFVGNLPVEGPDGPLQLTADELEGAAGQFLRAIQEAGRIYRHIADRRGEGTFVTEVSIDETDRAQSPGELFCILAMIAAEGIPVQTVAPKFTGRFNKGVDYVGDLAAFTREFNEDLAVLDFAIAEFGLPSTLKLSVHSGSDKFSIYPVIGAAIRAR